MPRRERKWMLLAVLAVAAILASARSLLGLWVEFLWFKSLGYEQVFLRQRGLEIGLFLKSAAITFAVLYGCFVALWRSQRFALPVSRSILVNGQPVEVTLGPLLRWLAVLVSGGIALLSAASIAENWSDVALFLWGGGGHSSRVLDPVLGKPLSFYLFRLPGWQTLTGWLLVVTGVICAAAFILGLLAGGPGARSLREPGDSSERFRAFGATGSALLLVLAWRVYLARFDPLLEHHTIFDGVNYTDAHVLLGGLTAVSLALIAGAGVAMYAAVRGGSVLRIAGAALPAVLCYVAVSVASWYVSGFVVKPNELVRETPYIANNIAMTRQAFGLDHFDLREFPADTNPAAADPAHNQVTLQNIRLWDWRALQDTLRQVQEIRTYYDFPDIDIDRYRVSGGTTQVMLAARELNQEKLPESSRNWINEKLIYTHGYGLTMNSVNAFTPEGLPVFLLSNMPVQSSSPELAVSRPQIYFGELTNDDVYVKTRQKEFDYPQGQTNSLTTYDGSGGIVLGGLLRRTLIALDRGDVSKVPFSDDVNSGSRLLMRRNLRERVSALAPFLTFDPDPYLTLSADGRLYWMIDAFTTSDRYPYATHYEVGDRSLNYIRNSVKVVVDAYNGTTNFYVFDAHDPILSAYRRIFPALFKDGSAMPAGLREHIRYPEVLLKTQAAAYALYHMTDPEVFFNREDLWTVATQKATDPNGEPAEPMQPNFVLMRLPGQEREEFIDILPFTPANRNNLIGWIAGRCDGTNYGTAVVYAFPKSRLVDGPQQIEARIDQNAELSGQLTLWNQQGSHVLRGSLLVIPTGSSLLYAEPIYLQAQQSPMPELRLVVLALQDKLAYGPTFRTALTSLFGDQSAVARPLQQSSGPAPAVQGAPETRALIEAASRAFEAYQRLTAAGKLAEAGQQLEELKRVLGQLSTQR